MRSARSSTCHYVIAPRTDSGNSGAYAVSQAVELGTERGGEPRTQHGEPVLDQSQLGPPLLGIDGEHSLQRLGRQVQAVDIE